MSDNIVYKGRPIAYIGYTADEMTFTYEGDAIPSFTAPIDRARDLYPEIFEQLPAHRIAQYEFSV